MNASQPVTSTQAADLERYRAVRAVMPDLAKGLSAEDLGAQAMLCASPGKWHLAHSSWFFEAMILAMEPGYRPVDSRFQTLFNSYYETLGRRIDRGERGLMTRPSLEEVMAYRREIDRRMADRLSAGMTDGATRYLFTLGLNHEQQHQELFLMDILALLNLSPLSPAAYAVEPRFGERDAPVAGFEAFEGGVVSMGYAAVGFAFDNEEPAHPVLVQPYALARDLVTNGDWIDFIEDGGYRKPDLWLSDGWDTIQAKDWRAPEYWREVDGRWRVFGLTGLTDIDRASPVRHISHYEADAYARWAGKRLPSEAEWEHAAVTRPEAFSNLFGEVWQHTSSAFAPYPDFAPTPGTASEYSGKFMANQLVLRGSSFATPPGHERATYRNFFYPQQRWAFSGLRLAESRGGLARVRGADQAEAGSFMADMIEGLSRPQKSLSPKYFYDAAGSDLFEDITRLPEYYPTRQEAALLRQLSPSLAAEFGDNAVLVEFGSGASEKTRILLDAAPSLSAYIPIDISPDALSAAAARISAQYPRLEVRPVVGDFLHLGELPELGRGRRIGFFPGSTIGNLSPEDAVAFLKNARERLEPGSLFILGVDLVKDPALLVAAYDDAEGVTAAFNLNLLARANGDLGADFDLDQFEHLALWNPDASRMEMHLRSRADQVVNIDGQRFRFLAGETLHTESSRKFTEMSVRGLAKASGWTLERFDVGPAPSVALALLSA